MLHVKTNVGLGDCFASRPTIAALVRAKNQDDVVLETAWPQVFWDIIEGERVRLKSPSNLNIRCAKRNVEESEKYYLGYREERADKMIHLGYNLHPGCKSIPEQIAESAGVEPEWDDFFVDLKYDICENEIPRSPLAVFRIPTIRTEYHNVARNPAPGLVAAAVDEIGGDFIHLNDAQIFGNETFDPKDLSERPCALASAGQLSLLSMLDLVSRARCVVTPISWMAWAAMAYQVPTLCIWGGYCSHKTIFGPLYNMAAQYEVVHPENGDFSECCQCFNPSHACAKSIPVERVREAARSLK